VIVLFDLGLLAKTNLQELELVKHWAAKNIRNQEDIAYYIEYYLKSSEKVGVAESTAAELAAADLIAKLGDAGYCDDCTSGVGHSNVDLKQSNVDLNQSSVDLKQSNVDLKQSNVDLKQSNLLNQSSLPKHSQFDEDSEKSQFENDDETRQIVAEKKSQIDGEGLNHPLYATVIANLAKSDTMWRRSTGLPALPARDSVEKMFSGEYSSDNIFNLKY
jgi:hypothetical protein